MMAFERRWWSWIALAALAALSAVLFVGWYVANVLPLDMRGGVTAATDALLALDIEIVLLGLAFSMVVKAVLARRRAMRLGAALDGLPDALPLARIPDDQTADGEGLDAVVARWPRARLVVAGQIVIEAIIAAFTCFLLLWLTDVVLIAIHATVPTWLAAFIRWSAPSNTRRDSHQIHVPHTTALLAGFLLFGGGALASLWFLTSLFIGTVLEPLRIEADAEGVTWYGVWGMRRHISWQEARLLEVKSYTISQGSGRPARQTFRYALRGRGASIRWYQLAGRNGHPLPGFARLLSAVIEHTGLQVRTLDPKLVALDQFMPVSLLERIDTHFARILIILIFGVAGVATLGFSEPKLLITEGAILGFGAVIALIGKLVKRAAQHHGSAEPGEVGPTGEIALSPDGVYEMTVGSAITFRFNQIAYAVLGALVALFGAFVLILSFVPVLHGRGAGSAPPVWVVGYFACTLILILGGTAIFVVSVRARDTIVLAAADGIRKRWLWGNTVIPWAQVEGIRRQFFWGTDGYKVSARGGGPTISWPSAPFHPSRKPQEPGAVQLTPEQMATLVAQRIGKEIEISD